MTTRDDRYPLPHITDFAAKLDGMQVFSVIDMVRGFHQISMAEEDIPKTALIKPFGLYEFTLMSYGFQNAARSFQRLMDQVLGD